MKENQTKTQTKKHRRKNYLTFPLWDDDARVQILF